MIVQDVTALPTFTPHGGPITHRSQDRNLTLLYNPYSRSYSSRVASYVIHEPSQRDHQFWYQTQYLFPLLGTPFTPVSGIERLPARSKLPVIPPYFALDIFLNFN